MATPEQTDTEYFAAVRAGDMAAARRMVDEAAMAAGYGVGRVYHGTGAKINAFDPGKVSANYNPRFGKGFYFSELKRVAEHYTRKGDSPGIHEFYLSLQNPLVVKSVKEYREAAMPNLSDWRVPVLSYEETLKAKGYDGVVFLQNGKMNEIVAFEPSQIKSADTITRDDRGNIVPLGRRFDPTSDDVRGAGSTRQKPTLPNLPSEVDGQSAEMDITGPVR